MSELNRIKEAHQEGEEEVKMDTGFQEADLVSSEQFEKLFRSFKMKFDPEGRVQ